MAFAKHAGLANPSCQLYMLFYYLGPASVAITLRRSTKVAGMKSPQGEYGSISMGDVVVEEYGTATDDRSWPNYNQIKFASFVALWDIGAQSMVYAGECKMIHGLPHCNRLLINHLARAFLPFSNRKQSCRTDNICNHLL